MSNERTVITFPPGRMVYGSVYNPYTKDYDGNPLVYKTGAKAGQPRGDFQFGLAIKKGAERDWRETAWGKSIYNTAVAAFPGGQTRLPSFAFKVTDGDGDIPNRKGNRPCDKEGYPGHWVLNFSSTGAPALFRIGSNGRAVPFDDPEGIMAGDMIEVNGDVVGNGNPANPGVYLNHSMVCWRGYHKDGRIVGIERDPDAAGFGQAPVEGVVDSLPGATPSVTPPPGTAPAPVYAAPTPPPATLAQMDAPPPPHPTFTDVPPPPSGPVMTAAAKYTYDQYRQSGWTDQQLIENGLMLP